MNISKRNVIMTLPTLAVSLLLPVNSFAKSKKTYSPGERPLNKRHVFKLLEKHYKSKTLKMSNKVRVNIPAKRESDYYCYNDRDYRVNVSTKMSKVLSLSIILDDPKHQNIICKYDLREKAIPDITSTIKVLNSTHIVGVIETDTTIYFNSDYIYAGWICCLY